MRLISKANNFMPQTTRWDVRAEIRLSVSLSASEWLKTNLPTHERMIALAASLPMIYAEWKSVFIWMGRYFILVLLLFIHDRGVEAAQAPSTEMALVQEEK